MAGFWGDTPSEAPLTRREEDASETVCGASDRKGWDDPIDTKLDLLAPRLGIDPAKMREYFWDTRPQAENELFFNPILRQLEESSLLDSSPEPEPEPPKNIPLDGPRTYRERDDNELPALTRATHHRMRSNAVDTLRTATLARMTTRAALAAGRLREAEGETPRTATNVRMRTRSALREARLREAEGRRDSEEEKAAEEED